MQEHFDKTQPLLIVPKEALMDKALTETTIKLHEFYIQKFQAWLNDREITDELIADYLTYLFNEGKSVSTIHIILTAIKRRLKQLYTGYNIDLPITSLTMRGIRINGRNRGIGQRRGLTWQEVEKICTIQEADCTLRGLRNSAVIRIMSDAMLRISEAAEILIDDLEGKAVRIRHSKTDQEGKGEYLYLCVETRKVIQQYLERSGLTEGKLFRRVASNGDGLYHDRKTGEIPALTRFGIREIIQRCAARVGITYKISGHSLRIGSAISLAQAGASVVDMQVAGRWKSPNMPAHYARAQLAEESPMARFKEDRR